MAQQMDFLLFPDQFGAHPDDTIEQAMAARDEAFAMVASGQPATMARAKIAIIALLARGGTITADDVAEYVPEIYERAPQAVGTAFGTLARQGVIVRVGYDSSRRKSRKAGTIKRWGRGPRWDQR